MKYNPPSLLWGGGICLSLIHKPGRYPACARAGFRGARSSHWWGRAYQQNSVPWLFWRVEELNVLGLPSQLWAAYPGEPCGSSSVLWTAENSFFLLYFHEPVVYGSTLGDAGSEWTQALCVSSLDALRLGERITRTASSKLTHGPPPFCILTSCVEKVACV